MRTHAALPLLFVLACLLARFASAAPAHAATWTADNGNGTFTNPLFYDEFSDPDLIRVGDDYYLTGTTMHTMPGLPILHSKDLVNWQLLGYVFDRLDLGPEFRLEDGKEIYGQGIWAPSFRHHNGTFHIFTNVNRHTTQHFSASNPAGPWTRVAMKCSLHDLTVLFDDDGKACAFWGYQGINFARLNDDLTDIVPETHRVIIEKSAGMGEGMHVYKIDGRYFITSAWFEGRMRMPCARADKLEGPYEVNPAISIDEDFGLAEGNRLWKHNGPPFDFVRGNTLDGGRMSLHQGGLVNTPGGEWWGFSMMDFNSVGRLTSLSPITWKDGWPYFGLPGNLRRTPRTWTKPNTGHTASPTAPYVRSDDFSGPTLVNVWQWNHVPDDTHWSLSARPGFLRLQPLPAPNFWRARNTLTQRAIGPRSSATTILDTAGLKPGDIAGLALLNLPYAWIGVRTTADGGHTLEHFNQLTGGTTRAPLPAGNRIWLRASCDFLTEKAVFSHSTDGEHFQLLGGEFETIFQLKTFQGVRYALFAFNEANTSGGDTATSASGHADFDRFAIDEPAPHGLMRPIPYGRTITLTVHNRDHALGTAAGSLAGVPAKEAAHFTVIDAGLGRVALRTDDARFVSVENDRVALTRAESPTAATTYQWTETVYGDLILLSLSTHRHLRIDPTTGALTANHPGPAPDRTDGSCFDWKFQER